MGPGQGGQVKVSGSEEERIISGYPGTTPRRMTNDTSLADSWTNPPLTDFSHLTTQVKAEETTMESHEVAWAPGELDNPQNRTLASKRIITVLNNAK
ncbi:hypothetical protein PTTG_28071 [Puccinia triticina 1-1 BBBD Race 1]|uniref:Uncharacterized protein n=2 Tax=Puccinia triticina TaxID=208348 RepID=A0A180GF94_PUCT1|nr:hypothetical protein PTTG_28071 [Puccinia triticina 1-1 BBBD Race 1]